MGYADKVQQELDENHEVVMSAKGYECEICGFTPPRGEDAINSLATHMHYHYDKFD